MSKAVIARANASQVPESTRSILDRTDTTVGGLRNLFATAAHSSVALESLWRQFLFAERSSLPEEVRIATALRVAQLNGCAYSLAAFTSLATAAGISDAAICDYRHGVAEDVRSRALLALVGRLANDHGHHAGFEVQAARGAGATEANLVEVVQLVALHSFVNSLACLAVAELDAPAVSLDLEERGSA